MSGFCVLLFGTMVYNEILSLESLGIYYPEKDLQESLLPSKSMKKKRRTNKRSASFSMLEETKYGGGNDDGDQNNEIVADDWFSPKVITLSNKGIVLYSRQYLSKKKTTGRWKVEGSVTVQPLKVKGNVK